MFSHGRDMANCQFLHNDNAKAIAIYCVLSENSRAKNGEIVTFYISFKV